LVGFASMLLLQALIAATGNYGFFNLLAVVLCLSVLDDRDLQWSEQSLRNLGGRWPWKQVLLDDRKTQPDDLVTLETESTTPRKSWFSPRRLITGVAGTVILAATIAQTAESLGHRQEIPAAIITLSDWVEPSRSFNSYGLFAVMTTKRPEIVVEGSDDGLSW